MRCIPRRPPRCRTKAPHLHPVIRRFLIFGKVQGVFFRDSTRREAQKLHIRGSARNLADGSVEVVAQGGADAMEHLRTWLQHGPPRARVVEVRETAPDPAFPIPQDFRIF